MRKELPGHTLSATALTHEAWFRMNEQTRTQWTGRSHFLAVASTVMRRILVHHAVAKRAEKRDAALVSMTHAEHVPAAELARDVVAVHEALLAFAAVDPRAASVVELKYFGGMENGEIAEALSISLATVKREWNVARAWLARELEGV
jgi:RNA polymerase sigma factor (TIGR02999 family)